MGFMGTPRTTGEPLEGILRFYDATKGYGYVAVDGSPDAYLSRSVVLSSGIDPSSLRQNALVSGTADWSGKAAVTHLASVGETVAGIRPRNDRPGGEASGKLVRWEPDRGFGLLEAAGVAGNVFVHVTTFERSHVEPSLGSSYPFTWEEVRGRPTAIAVGEGKPEPEPKPTSELPTWITGLAQSFAPDDDEHGIGPAVPPPAAGGYGFSFGLSSLWGSR
jgi:cold shock CspA family protein